MNWPVLNLGEVVTPVQRAENPIAGRLYRQLGVKLWGEGAYEREPVDGGGTKYAQLFRAVSGDIIVNKIWARNGSVAVVSENLDGCYGSGEFPMFAPKPERLDSRWVHWLTKTPAFWAQCDEESRGTSGKNRIRPERFLEIRIPVPTVAEQQRVIARIEELAAQIHEARILRHQAAEEAGALAASSISATFSSIPAAYTRELGEVAEIIGGNSLPDISTAISGAPEVLFVKVSDMNRTGNEIYIHYSATGVPTASPFLKGVRVLPKCSIVFPKRGGAIATNKKRILKKPAVLDPNMMGVFTRESSVLSHEFLFSWFKSIDLALLQNGTSVPQINKGDLAPLKIPVPPLPQQCRIIAELDALQAELDALKRLQTETAAELDAMLPAILDRAFKGEL